MHLAFATAPSIAQFIAARVMRQLRNRYPDLFVDLNVLKIEETLDYLPLERGEFVIMSSEVSDAAIETEEIARGRVVAILPEGHPLAERDVVSARDLAAENLISVDPRDPHGALLARPFEITGVRPRPAMRGRVAQKMISMTRHGLGVAVIDEFSVAEVYMPGLVRRPLPEEVVVRSFVCRKKGRVLSGFAEAAIGQSRRALADAMAAGPRRRARTQHDVNGPEECAFDISPRRGHRRCHRPTGTAADGCTLPMGAGNPMPCKVMALVQRDCGEFVPILILARGTPCAGGPAGRALRRPYRFRKVSWWPWPGPCQAACGRGAEGPVRRRPASPELRRCARGKSS
ncbi:MAG: hypothetical protein KatS3mg118_2469 [Paracoccaceae bacterium]|nr:MAG: hypothetical protein KatS3mg118_2469 [Paracoccaceae bacterium]